MFEPAPKKHEKYERLIAKAKQVQASTVAVAHPCDRSSLEGALDAAQIGLINPILVGPRARIRQVATDADLDISALAIDETVNIATPQRNEPLSWFARARQKR